MFSLDELNEFDINSKTQQIADMLNITQDQAKIMLSLFVDTSLMAMNKEKDTKEKEDTEKDEEEAIETDDNNTDVMVTDSDPMPF